MAFLEKNFHCAWKKVGTFTVAEVDGKVIQRQGGSVAAYFMTPEGNVLGAALGGVEAGFFLEEAKWAVESSRNPSGLARAHAARAEDLTVNPFRNVEAFT